MRSVPLLLALLLLMPLVPAQAQGAADAAVAALEVVPEPVTNVSTFAVATVVTNGPGTLTVTFTYADGTPLARPDEPGGMGHSFTTFVDSGGSHEFRLPFTPPMERRGNTTLRASVQMSGDADPSNDTLERTVFVRHPALNLTFEQPSSLYVLPGGITPLRYVIRNDGNANETPMVTLVNGTNWTLLPQEHRLPPILPGKNATGVVLVVPAPDAGNLSLNLTVASSIRPSLRLVAEAPKLRPADNATFLERGVALVAVPPMIQAFENESVSRGFLVRNDGVAPEVVLVNATLSNATLGWRATLNVTDDWPAHLARPANGTLVALPLLPGESLPLTVNLTRGIGASPNLTLRLEATLANADLLAAVATPRHVALEEVALRAASPDLRLVAVRGPDRVYRDDDVEIRAELRNFGRVATNETKLDLDVADALRVVRNHTVEVPSLGPGESRAFSWTFRVDGMQGPYALVAALRNASEGATPKRLDLHVRSPEITLLSPDALDAVPGTTLRLSALPAGFGVRNAGDRSETVVAELDARGAPWLAARWETTVAPNAVEALPLEIPVPDHVENLTYEVTIRAWVKDREAFQASAELPLRVQDDDPPRLAFAGPTVPGAVGKPADLAVRVDDATGFGDGEVLVRLPDGTHQSLLLDINASDPALASATFVPRQAGTHVLEFRVSDAAGVAGRAVLPNVTWLVEAPDYGGVRPVGFADGAPVGAARLRLEEVAPNTTATLHVDVGRGFELVPPPYEFNLPAREGPHQIRARATSLAGVVREASWNVTLDRTPPSVEGAWRATPDGYLEIEATAGNGTKEVLVRFLTPSGSKDAPLEKRGGASFGARLAPPEGWSQMTLIAKDAAGNEASFAMATPQAETPASAGLLAILALVAAAWGGRRRRS